MKSFPITALLAALLFASCPLLPAAVTGRAEDTSLAGTEKLLSDSSGADTYILVTTLRNAAVWTGGCTATGSSDWDWSGSTGGFKTSTGANVFGGSSHSFAGKLFPASNDGAALGDSTHNFSDLFLASGALINFNNGDVVLTHSLGLLTMGTGDLRVTTPGSNAASVPTIGSTSTLTNKTLTAPTLTAVAITGTSTIGNGMTITTPVLSGSITGTYTLAGTPTITSPTINTPTLTAVTITGTSTIGNGMTITTPVLSGSITGTYTLAGTPTITAPTITACHITGTSTIGNGMTLTTPVLSGSVTGTYTLAGTPTITAPTINTPTLTAVTITGTSTIGNGMTITTPVLSGSVTGTYTLAGTPTITSPTITAPTITGTGTIGNGMTITTPVLSGSVTGTYTLAGTPTITSPTITGAICTPKVTTISGDGAVTLASGVVVLTKGSAAAITVAAPSAQDGTRITIVSNSNFAHVVTFTGSTLLDGTTGANSTATFAAFKGASVTFIAVGATWLVESLNQVTAAP